LSSPVVLGGSIYPGFGTSSPTAGAATNADSTPASLILDNGVAMGYAPAPTNLATGLYVVPIAATIGNGFTAGHRYSVFAIATVGGVTGRECIDEFEVVAVDVNAIPTASQNADAVWAKTLP